MRNKERIEKCHLWFCDACCCSSGKGEGRRLSSFSEYSRKLIASGQNCFGNNDYSRFYLGSVLPMTQMQFYPDSVWAWRQMRSGQWAIWPFFEILFSPSASSMLLHWHCCVVVGYHQKSHASSMSCHSWSPRCKGEIVKEIQALSRTARSQVGPYGERPSPELASCQTAKTGNA